MAYATQRPSGENTELTGKTDRTCAKGSALLSGTENVQREKLEPEDAANRNRFSARDHDSGMWATPRSGVVRRRAVSVPSARCQKMPGSPSRSDWNATR